MLGEMWDWEDQPTPDATGVRNAPDPGTQKNPEEKVSYRARKRRSCEMELPEEQPGDAQGAGHGQAQQNAPRLRMGSRSMTRSGEQMEENEQQLERNATKEIDHQQNSA